MRSTSIARPRGSLRIVIVDDHPVVRRGLADILSDAPDITVCGQAATLAEAVSSIRTTSPDVALVDLSLGQESGLDLVAALKNSESPTRVLVMSAHDERLHADRALKAGALGYIMKNAEPAELLNAVRRVGSGQPYVSSDAADRILSRLGSTANRAEQGPLERLSNRERQVFALVGQGLATREIAASLGVSIKTIESHYARLKEKLGARSGRELSRMAAVWTEEGVAPSTPVARSRPAAEPV